MKDQKEDEIHLLDYWRVLVKRRWIFFSSLIVLVFLGALRSFLQEPKYTAITRIQIERNSPNILPFQEVIGSPGDSYKDFYETQYALIQSRQIAREVIASLRLDRFPEFRITTPETRPQGPTLEQLVETLRIDRFLRKLRVDPVQTSRLVDISFTSLSADLAARVANRVAETYIAFNSQIRYNTTERATASLEHQIANLQEDINFTEQEMQEYARKHGIIPLSNERNITLKNLENFSEAFAQAQEDRIEKEALFVTLRESGPEDLREVVTSKLIQDLSRKSAELVQKYAQLSGKYQPDWPEMVRLRRELDATNERLELEKTVIFQQVLAAGQGDYEAARNEEIHLERILENRKRQYQDISLKEIRYNSLKMEVANRRSTLEALVRRQTETSSSIGIKDSTNSNIRIVDLAEVPISASSPKLFRDLLASLLTGVLLGIGMAFLLEYVDKSVRSPEDFQEVTGFPCIGLIPERQGVSRLHLVTRNRQENSSLPPVELISHRDSQSQVSEAFREVRTSILVSRPGGPPRTLLVTSTQPGEGKTVVACNLAVTLAQMGRRVLLVDSDLRKPQLQKILGLSDEDGLTHYLSGTGAEPPRPVPTGIPGLDLIGSGPVPPNPADLLDSDRFRQFQQELQGMGYQHILFDSPPVAVVSDPSILASRMDGVILVVHSGVTSRDGLAQTSRRLRQVQAKVIGGVMNQVPLASAGYYGHPRRGYYGESGTADSETGMKGPRISRRRSPGAGVRRRKSAGG